MGTAFEYHSIDEDEVRENIEGTKEYVKLTRDIGGSGVKVRPNGDQLEHGIPKEETFKQIGEALRECGEYPYQELFRKLNEINYDGFCCAEVHSPSDQPERFMKYYKALFDAYSK